MNTDFDITIVGGGPVGSTIAYYLSQKKLSVCIIEKKTEIGYPLQCAGILSKKILNLNELPDGIILNKVKGAYLHCQNHILKVEKNNPEAYIINRIAYDEFLLKRALDNNVKLINQKAVDFDIENGITYLSNNRTISSKIIVGCDGYNSLLSSKMNNIQKSFNASQFLVEISDETMHDFRKTEGAINDYVDTYLFEQLLPGFLWIIPTENNIYRIGVFSQDSHKNQNIFIENFLETHFEYEIKEKYKGFIPIYDEKNKLCYKRAILIGDAAAQIKPTSGGGLIMGFDACKIACEIILKSLNNTDNLKNYETEFKNKYLKEINYQFKVQKTLNLLNNDDINFLFEKLKENNCEEIISEYGDMDDQSHLVKEFIKRGLIFKIIPTFLFKKVTGIFGF